MFSIRLKELRESAGYRSQQSFADAFGVAQSTVGNWEAGKREPNYEITIRLADFFGVSIDYLLGHNADSVGTRICAEREANKMTLDKLSELTGIEKRTIVNYESGKAPVVPLSHLEKISAVLNAPISYLENGVDPILPDGDPFEALFDLPDDERQLVSYYRALTPDRQTELLRFAEYQYSQSAGEPSRKKA